VWSDMGKLKYISKVRIDFSDDSTGKNNYKQH
jgi:hypothetical protein